MLLLLAACRSERVAWSPPQSAPGDTLGAVELQGDSIGFVRSPVIAAPDDPLACPGSVVSAEDRGVVYTAWLRIRPDSSVAVMAQRIGGGPATPAAMVDSVDVGRMGCQRPPPSIAVSHADGYVHVAYSLKAPEGYGVFFAHSMDRGASYHSPMIVVYGDRLSATAIAADGARVALAYEDPSGNTPRIDVALSKTQGHTFEPRERASPDEMPATRPRIAVRDTTVVLTFAGADTAARALRVGKLGAPTP